LPQLPDRMPKIQEDS